jgi:hypothetical protein
MKSQGAARVFALMGLLVVVSPVQAQESAGTFPSKPIRIVVGNAAGGGTDAIARLVGQKMSDVLGQPVVVENKPGGSNMIAAQYVAKSPADGYTLLMGSIGMLTINPAVFASVPYDTMRDFAPISLICSYPLVLTVNATTPVRDVQELVAYIKANPEKANAGGTGTIYQIAAKMFELRTGTKTQFIPYRSNNESMMGLIRGDTLLSIVDTGPVSGRGRTVACARWRSRRHSACRLGPTFPPWRKPGSTTWSLNCGPGCSLPPVRRPRSLTRFRMRSLRPSRLRTYATRCATWILSRSAAPPKNTRAGSRARSPCGRS